MPFQLQLPRSIHEEMIAQALAESPNECCGMLAGVLDGGTARVVRRYPLVNALASPTRYLSEARSHLNADRDARERGLEFVAVYHSHPTSPPIPSRTDLGSNFWESVIHFIISLETRPPEMRGWWLGSTDYRPADWMIVDG
jgi:[CysO sulfur-carrier protein]-S-L-cysteine hydrolase